MNAYEGIKTDNGAFLSPATVFAHEADHAVDDMTDAWRHSDRVKQKDSKYDNLEEKRVITGSEQKTVRANGEIKTGRRSRNNHKGITIYTISPTSNEYDATATKYFYKKHSRR